MANPYDIDGKRIRVGYRVAYQRAGELYVSRVVEHPVPWAPYKLENGLWRWGSQLVVLEEPVWPNS